jgi:hypothetical protein
MTPSEFNSCILTAKFAWSNTDLIGRWSTPQETYKLRTSELAKVNYIEADYPYDIVTTRVRVRGQGPVMLLHYESSDGKDFRMAGRATPFTAETES